MKRKILSFVLVAAMLVSMVVFAPSAGATESLATLEFGDAVGAPGETVTVDLKITTAQLSGLQFMFEYDASRLTYDSITWTSAYGTTYPKDLSLNPLFVQFTENGPYNVLSMAFDAGAQDFSAGVLAATLTFTVKEDAPLGDAYVKFVPLYEGAAQPNKIEPGSILPADITFVDGAVTVLPADYVDSTVNTAADFGDMYVGWDYWDSAAGMIDYEGDSTDGIVILGYAGTDTTVVIPSEIDGYPVVRIESNAFANKAVTSVVIPASVKEIAPAAFVNCASLTDVYVLNADATLGLGAIGYKGTYVVNPGTGTAMWRPAPQLALAADGVTPLTTIHAAAGGSVEAYANGAIGWNPVVNYMLTFDGATYMVPANTVAPGTAIVDGKTAIAWTDGTNTYAAGSAITLTGDVALTPVTINAPATAATVDFKLTAEEADLAMRFTASLSLEDYAKLADLGSVKLGMLITPAKYVSKAGSFTKEALDDIDAKNGAYVDIAIDGYYDVTATDYIFAGSLKGFSAATLAKNPDFAAILYATVTTEGGDVFTVYGDYDFGTIQDVKGVAESLATSSDLTDTQKGWLTTLVGKFTA